MNNSKSEKNPRYPNTPIPLYVPNLLCYMRIILSFASIYFASIIHNSDRPLLYILLTAFALILAAALDHIDGKIARYYNQCSSLGVLLDIIADNILRGCSWIVCIIASISQSIKRNDSSDLPFIVPMIAVAFISIEWMTMFSTQMLTLQRDKSHWKELPKSTDKESGRTCTASEKSPLHNEEMGEIRNQKKAPTSVTTTPWLIEQIFRNNFCNVLGVVTIYGSMAGGINYFLHLERDPLLETFPWLEFILNASVVIACVGRLLALYAEAWFCFDYFRFIVGQDVEKKTDEE